LAVASTFSVPNTVSHSHAINHSNLTQAKDEF
jgi:hypothetical protein